MAMSAEGHLIALVDGDEPMPMLRLALDGRSLQGIKTHRLNPKAQPMLCWLDDKDDFRKGCRRR
jgi:hypothetical protein